MKLATARSEKSLILLWQKKGLHVQKTICKGKSVLSKHKSTWPYQNESNRRQTQKSNISTHGRASQQAVKGATIMKWARLLESSGKKSKVQCN